MQKIFFTLLISLLVFSCKSIKNNENRTYDGEIPKTEIPIITPKTNVYSNIVKKISAKQNFEQIKIQSVINANLEKYIPPIDATIYIEKDKKIWMNLSSLFLPVARGLAEPNSVKAYEKINKTYIDSDYNYLNKLLKVDFFNYEKLQSLILGELIFKIDLEKDKFTKIGDELVIEVFELLKMNINGKPSLNKVYIKYNAQQKLSNLQLIDTKTKKSFEIEYTNWLKIENLDLPKNVKIIIKSEKNEEILIENTKFGFSKTQTPYSVPNNYTKTIIK